MYFILPVSKEKNLDFNQLVSVTLITPPNPHEINSRCEVRNVRRIRSIRPGKADRSLIDRLTLGRDYFDLTGTDLIGIKGLMVTESCVIGLG